MISFKRHLKFWYVYNAETRAENKIFLNSIHFPEFCTAAKRMLAPRDIIIRIIRSRNVVSYLTAKDEKLNLFAEDSPTERKWKYFLFPALITPTHIDTQTPSEMMTWPCLLWLIDLRASPRCFRAKSALRHYGYYSWKSLCSCHLLADRRLKTELETYPQAFLCSSECLFGISAFEWYIYSQVLTSW